MRNATRARSTAPSRVRIAAARQPSRWKLALIAGATIVAAGFLTDRARADAALCATGVCASEARTTSNDRYLRLSTILPGTRTAQRMHRAELSDQDFSSFSGIGMIVCTHGGVSRSSTAFLVGAFDVAVTVAHTFQTESDEQPECVYNSTDSLGQIRERIPVAYIKSQWKAEPDASGELSKDLAVVRLAQPSRYAQRTMPLGRFSGKPATVLMVGFKEAAYWDTMKLKKRGRVYDETINLPGASLGGFVHDMDSLHIAPGAPVIDERSGIIIGIHTRLDDSRNTMITMNDWLEATLRAELQAQPGQPQQSRAN